VYHDMNSRPETINFKRDSFSKYVVTFKIAALLDFFFLLRHQRLFSKATVNIRVHKCSNFSVESGSPDALIWLEGQRLWKKSRVCTLGLLLYLKLTAILKCLLQFIILKFPYLMPNVTTRIFKILRGFNFTEVKTH
jgi:hypothetical protein